jgi:chromate reductase
MRILAISGSLRSDSSCTSVLRAAATLAPADVDLVFFEGLGELPHFHPDVDPDRGPRPVEEFRAALRAADGVMICTPEYAFGMPGVLKNAIEWTVSTGELVHKPLAALSASPSPEGGAKALRWLLETLSALTAGTDPSRTLAVSMVRTKYGAQGDPTGPEALAELAPVVRSLVEAMRSRLNVGEPR